MAWRVAKALDKLLAQINATYPNRSKVSDGSIGDAAHASRSSDHNPWYGPGIVTARDFTHDPANGADMNKVSEQLVASRDPRIKYIIWNRRIIDSRVRPWTWQPYNGANPHNKHMHVSVMDNGLCDDTRDWNLTGGTNAAPPTTPTGNVLQVGSSGESVRKLQGYLNRMYPAYSTLAVDGQFGPATEAVVKEFQRRVGIAADGIVGPVTLGRLGLTL